MESLTDEIHDHAIQLDNQQGSNTELQKNLDQAMAYIDLLENRQREKDRNLLDVPEQLGKGTEMIPFLVKRTQATREEYNFACKLSTQNTRSCRPSRCAKLKTSILRRRRASTEFSPTYRFNCSKGRMSFCHYRSDFIT